MRILKLASHRYLPWIASFILGTIGVLAMPDWLTRYNLRIEDKFILNKNGWEKNYFVDLDSNGNTERIKYHLNPPGIPSALVYSVNGKLLRQFSAVGKMIPASHLIFGDSNEDGLSEVYIPYMRNDSVFIVGHIQPGLVDTEFDLREIFITTTRLIDNKIDISVNPLPFHDLDKDGHKEAMMAINAGYTLVPRGIYAFDFFKQRVYHTDTLGPTLNRPVYFDVDGDGIEELIPVTSSPFNIREDAGFPYLDRYPWYIVLDNRLKVKTAHRISRKLMDLHPHKVVAKDSSYLFLTTIDRDAGTPDSVFHLTDSRGKLIMSKSYTLDTVLTRRNRSLQANNKLYFIREGGKVYRIDNRLTLHFIKDLKFGEQKAYLQPLDINHDGVDEFILMHESRDKITVYQPDFSHPVSIKFPLPVNIPRYYSVRKHGDEAQFSAVSSNFHWLVSYKENPWYFLKYPLHIGVYLLAAGLVFGVRKIRQLSRSSKEHAMLELQLKSFKDQFNTHFTFNIMNSINSMILNEEKEAASLFFNRFSTLLRRAFEHSENTYTTLKEDLDYTRDYLTLQQYRYKELINFDIIVEEGVNLNQKVPKLLTHTFAENALKHGLLPQEKPGNLKINVTGDNNRTKITITDDGIGRSKAAKAKKGFGRGLTLVQQYFKLFYKLHKIKVSFEVRDLVDRQGHPAGTEIIVTLLNNNDTA